MSCPDWRTLAAAREADPWVDSPAWTAACRHLAECSRCRREALAVDPLLVFAGRPERRVSPSEIAGMQAGVASLVRAGRVGRAGSTGSAGSIGSDIRGGQASAGTGAPPVGFRSVTRFAATLGACILLALSGAPRFHTAGPDGRDVVAVREVVGAGAAQMHSSVEELDRPGARIYDLPQADMAVVMIVDASLDV